MPCADVGFVALRAFDPGIVMTVAYQRYAPKAGFQSERRVGFSLWFI